jgi:RecA-family ATPase
LKEWGKPLPGSSYLKLPRQPHKWLIEGLLPSAGLVALFGKAKTRKSFFAWSALLALAGTAETWEGFTIKQHGPVFILQLDTPREEWADRYERTLERGVPMKTLDNVYTLDKAQIPCAFNIIDPEHRKRVTEFISDVKPIAVFVDTVREAHFLNENDSTDMKKVISGLQDTCRACGSCLIGSTHAKKDSQFSALVGDDIMDKLRGSNYFVGAADMIIWMQQNRMSLQGRAVEHTSYKLSYDDYHWPHIDIGHLKTVTAHVLLDFPEESQNQKIKRIMQECGELGEEVSRSTVMRYLKTQMRLKQGGSPTSGSTPDEPSVNQS